MKALDRIVFPAIFANAALVAYGMYDHSHEHLVELGESALLTFFAVEIVLRIVTTKRPWRDGWLVADSVIIVLALLPIVGAGVAVLRLARLARLTHLVKHLTVLRMFV